MRIFVNYNDLDQIPPSFFRGKIRFAAQTYEFPVRFQKTFEPERSLTHTNF
ncbi:hypothetical protein SAMN02746095_03218 [Acidocella aminolytica 101 = DSM 11237]|jgi:hypothetical protein|nr:hypothetical protein SAMN02746095_03218 [Acidocella aminolytica 101 = DSM 11237]